MHRSRTTQRLLTPRSGFTHHLSALQGVRAKRNAVGSDGDGVSRPSLPLDGQTVVIEVIAGISVVRRIDEFVEGYTQHVDGPAYPAGYARRHKLAQANVLADPHSLQPIELHVDGFVIEPHLLCIVVVVPDGIGYVQQ